PGLCGFEAEVEAFIPQDYMPDENERLNFYKKFLNADDTSAGKILKELEDICGPAPKSVRNIADIIALRSLAAKMSVRHIEQSDSGFEIYFARNAKVPQSWIEKISAEFKDKMRFVPSPLGDGIKLACRIDAPLEFALRIVSSLLPATAEKGIMSLLRDGKSKC
ncbi:MAG: hypothetical protein NTW04_03060, partial [Elusimicrobia bacterium]|nr:hypothetical protein [Elusimicrobiota bacterium]